MRGEKELPVTVYECYNCKKSFMEGEPLYLVLGVRYIHPNVKQIKVKDHDACFGLSMCQECWENAAGKKYSFKGMK